MSTQNNKKCLDELEAFREAKDLAESHYARFGFVRYDESSPVLFHATRGFTLNPFSRRPDETIEDHVIDAAFRAGVEFGQQ